MLAILLIRFSQIIIFDFYKTDIDMYKKTIEQIEEYENLARGRDLLWTK